MMSNDHQSPITSSALATGHKLPCRLFLFIFVSLRSNAFCSSGGSANCDPGDLWLNSSETCLFEENDRERDQRESTPKLYASSEPTVMAQAGSPSVAIATRVR